jgi:hypothetical protein
MGRSVGKAISMKGINSVRSCGFSALVSAMLLGWTALPSAAENSLPVFRPVLETTRAAVPVNIDGILNEPTWKSATRISNFVERFPGDNTVPEVATEGYITYDADNLYVAFVCHDDPSKIRATMCQRDQFSGDDAIVILLDTYGNAAWAYEFFVNPYGIQKDRLWSSVGSEDAGYDLIWRSAGQITDSGYQVEVAIPFASMRFPNKDIQSWRMDFWREHPRETFKQYSWAANDRNVQCWPCQWGTVNGIHDVHPGKGIEILPAFVGHQSGGLTDPRGPDSPFKNGDPGGELSLGGKYSLSSDVTAEATVNPDFSQIESDAVQIDINSTTALYYPERRPFFQEGSDIFQTLFNSFYSRLISNPQYAAKLTGRVGPNSIGFLTALDEKTWYIIPMDQSSLEVMAGRSLVSVLRGTHAFGESSRLGFMLNDRRFENGGIGTVLSLDGTMRLSSNYVFDGQFIGSYTREPDNPARTAEYEGYTFNKGKNTVAFDGESFYGNAFIVRLLRGARHWNFHVDYNQLDPTYRTEVGFDPVNNHRTMNVISSYTFYPKNGLLERITPYAYTFRRWNFDGGTQIEYSGLGIESNLNVAQAYVGIQFNKGSQYYAGEFFGPLREASININGRLSNQIGGWLYLERGVDIAYSAMQRGNKTLFGTGFTIKPIDRLTIEPDLNFLRMSDINTGEKFFSGYTSRTRIRYQATRALSFRLIVQYDDFGKSWDLAPLMTYRVSSFSVFYLGSTYDYNDTGIGTQDKSNWRLTDRRLFMKLQYLFQM